MAGKRSLQRTPEKLAEALKHWDYEHSMLAFTAHALATRKDENRLLRNALLESFLVHTRVLHETLFSSEAHDDTVLAKHFFTQGAWEKNRSPEPAEFKDARLLRGPRQPQGQPMRLKDYINTEIVHLTYNRIGIQDEERGWLHGDIAKLMEGHIAEFNEMVKAAKKSGELPDV